MRILGMTILLAASLWNGSIAFAETNGLDAVSSQEVLSQTLTSSGVKPMSQESTISEKTDVNTLSNQPVVNALSENTVTTETSDQKYERESAAIQSRWEAKRDRHQAKFDDFSKKVDANFEAAKAKNHADFMADVKEIEAAGAAYEKKHQHIIDEIQKTKQKVDEQVTWFESFADRIKSMIEKLFAFFEKHDVLTESEKMMNSLHEGKIEWGKTENNPSTASPSPAATPTTNVPLSGASLAEEL